jgi:hypothetical protein
MDDRNVSNAGRREFLAKAGKAAAVAPAVAMLLSPQGWQALILGRAGRKAAGASLEDGEARPRRASLFLRMPQSRSVGLNAR